MVPVAWIVGWSCDPKMIMLTPRSTVVTTIDRQILHLLRLKIHLPEVSCGFRTRFVALWCCQFFPHVHHWQSDCWARELGAGQRRIDYHRCLRPIGQEAHVSWYHDGCESTWNRPRSPDRRSIDAVRNVAMVLLCKSAPGCSNGDPAPSDQHPRSDYQVRISTSFATWKDGYSRIRPLCTSRNPVPLSSRMGRKWICLGQRHGHRTLLWCRRDIFCIPRMGESKRWRGNDSSIYGPPKDCLVQQLGHVLLFWIIVNPVILSAHLFPSSERSFTYTEVRIVSLRPISAKLTPRSSGVDLLPSILSQMLFAILSGFLGTTPKATHPSHHNIQTSH